MTPIKTNLILVAVLFASFVLTACGGGGGGASGSSAAPVAKVVIQQSGLVLSAMGATKQLSAVAYDAQGQVVNASIRWSSTQPAISVDGTGKVTATSNNGSSQIVAEAENIKSAPLLAIVTTFPADAVLLTDAQIVGEPFETNPTALPSVDNTYKVNLTGVNAPAMGALLINAESKPVAGRVVAVDTAAGQTTVTLAQVSMREAFPNLELNEVIDLTNAEIIFPADVTAGYDIQRIGNTINFTPKAAAAAPVLLKSAAKTTNQPSAKLVTLPGGIVMDCVATITGDGTNLPIQLSVPPTISVTRNISLDTKYSVLNGLERLVLKSEVAAKVEASVGVVVAFEGKVSCEKELYVIRIPVGGPLSLFVGGLVPIKAGFEAGGKVTVATASLGIKAEGKLVSEFGVVCPDGTNCALTGSLTPTGTAVPVFDLPDIGDLRFEPTFSGFAKAELAIGNPTFTRLRLDTFYLQAGPKLAFSFAPQLSQIADTNYKSNYVLQTEKKLGLGHKFGDAMKRLGIEIISAFEIAEVVEIGKSPTGTVTADRTTFVAGDVINFHVALDAGTANLIPLLGPYNVSRILLVSNDGPLSTSVIASVDAANGQTVFDIPYTATRSGNVNEIFAFVDTWIIPTQDLLTLEVGVAEFKGTLLNVVLPATITTTGIMLATVTEPDGSGGFRPVPNILLQLTPTCATTDLTSGRTDASGQLSVTVTPVSGCTSLSINVLASADLGTDILAQKMVNTTVSLDRVYTGTISVTRDLVSNSISSIGPLIFDFHSVASYNVSVLFSGDQVTSVIGNATNSLRQHETHQVFFTGFSCVSDSTSVGSTSASSTETTPSIFFNKNSDNTLDAHTNWSGGTWTSNADLICPNSTTHSAETIAFTPPGEWVNPVGGTPVFENGVLVAFEFNKTVDKSVPPLLTSVFTISGRLTLQ